MIYRILNICIGSTANLSWAAATRVPWFPSRCAIAMESIFNPAAWVISSILCFDTLTRAFHIVVDTPNNDGCTQINTAMKSKFTTYDEDNDNDKSRNCALHFSGAWWHNGCFTLNINGNYSVTASVPWESIMNTFGAVTSPWRKPNFFCEDKLEIDGWKKRHDLAELDYRPFFGKRVSYVQKSLIKVRFFLIVWALLPIHIY